MSVEINWRPFWYLFIIRCYIRNWNLQIFLGSAKSENTKFAEFSWLVRFFYFFTCTFSVIWLVLSALAVIGQSDHCGFRFTTLNHQSLYCMIRFLLEAHETKLCAGIWPKSEKQTKKHLNLERSKFWHFAGICLQMLSHLYLAECLLIWVWWHCE